MERDLKLRTGILSLAFVLLGGCNSERGSDFRHQELYRTLQGCAESFTLVDGNWMDDFGDSAFWGLSYYARAGTSEGNPAYQERAQGVSQRNREVIRDADLITGDVNEMVMAALGLIEYMAATDDPSALSEVDTLIDVVNRTVETLGFYIPPEATPGYAMQTYGPVSINGLLSLLSLQRAILLPGDNREELISWAESVAYKIEELFWQSDSMTYAFGNGREGLFLYPNVTMILFHARLYQLTGRVFHRNRALALYHGIQPLKVTAGSGLAGAGRYRSPYSAETMGAKTDDYSTLSAQNYLMFALMVLFEITGDSRFLEEINPVLDFIQHDLLGQACLRDISEDGCVPACGSEQSCREKTCLPDACCCSVLHHWMDGRVAVADDPEFFCSGCNLQLLYLLWYRQNMIP